MEERTVIGRNEDYLNDVKKTSINKTISEQEI